MKNLGLKKLKNTKRIKGNKREFATRKFKDIWYPLLSTIVALAGILSGAYFQKVTIQAEYNNIKYQVTFDAKQKAYINLMVSMQDAYNESQNSGITLSSKTSQVAANYYGIAPFLSDKDRRTLLDDITYYINMCNDYDNFRRTNLAEYIITFDNLKEKIDDMLIKSLFGETY